MSKDRLSESSCANCFVREIRVLRGQVLHTAKPLRNWMYFAERPSRNSRIDRFDLEFVLLLYISLRQCDDVTPAKIY